MSLFHAGLPFSYAAIGLIFLLGVCITTLVFGIVAGIVFIICIFTGILRISPILDAITKCIEFYNPGTLKSIIHNIRESFLVEYPDGTPEPNKPHLFLFHPHGLLSAANMLHIGTDITDWSIRPIKGTALHLLQWLPFGQEILEKLNFIPSNYDDMKSVLKGGESLSACLGGVREILYTEPGLMKLSILKKRGAFRLALETGTPLIPVLSYGENELFQIMETPLLSWIQEKLMKYGLCLPIPTIESWMSWYGILYKPLENPIRTVIGKAIEVPEAHEPTDQEIHELREMYFVALKDLYARTRPDSYNKDLNIV